MLDAYTHTALIRDRERELRARVARPRVERPARPRRSLRLPRVVFALRTLRTRA